MTIRVLACVLVLGSVTACSADEDAASVSADDAGTSSSSGEAAPSSSGGSTSSSSGAPSSSSGATDAGPADAGELDAAAPGLIDPIEVGRSWTYDVTQLGFYPLCPEGLHTAHVTGSHEVDGKTALTTESLCEDLGPYDYAVEGDAVFVHDDVLGEWNVSLDAPVEENHAWTADGHDFQWHAAGTVTVTAGTFTDCWSAAEVADYDSYTVFCRGVGPVHWHYEDGNGNGYDAVLTEKSF